MGSIRKILVLFIVLSATTVVCATAMELYNTGFDVVTGLESIGEPDSISISSSSTPESSESSESPASSLEGYDRWGESKRAFAMLALVIILFIALCMDFFLHISHFDRFLHGSAATVVFTIFAGIAFHFTVEEWLSPDQETKFDNFDAELFFMFLLPPIIFEAGYSMKRKNFFRNIVPILTFAVVGTFISAIVVSVSIFLLGVVGIVHRLSLIDSLIFGSLISAVDPVTVIAIFQSLNSDVNLHAMIFGESIMNDAVCIVLFRTMLIFVGEPADALTVSAAVGSFFVIFIGSFLIGTGSGILSALFFKYIDTRKMPHLETAIFGLLVYIPYLLAEGCQMSGIVTVLFNGATQAHYTLYNLSPTSQATTRNISQTLAYLAETSVFAYLGLALFSMEHHYYVGLIVASILLCIIGRFFNIFPLSLVINLIRKKTGGTQIPYRNQTLLFWSGLRGAIAFALAVSVPRQVEAKDAILTTTLVVVLFTIFVFGSTAYSFTKILKIKSAEDVEAEMDEIALQAEREPGSLSKYNVGVAWFLGLDKRYVQGWLKRDVQSTTTEDRGAIFYKLPDKEDGNGAPVAGSASQEAKYDENFGSDDEIEMQGVAIEGVDEETLVLAINESSAAPDPGGEESDIADFQPFTLDDSSEGEL